MESVQKSLQNKASLKSFVQEYQRLVNEDFKDEQVQVFLKDNQSVLTKAIIQKSQTKIHEFVTETKRIKETGVSQNPGFVPKLVLNHGFIDVTYVPTEDYLLKEDKRLMRSRLNLVEMPIEIAQHHLSQVDVTEGRVAIIKAFADFKKNYLEQSQFTKGVYLYGSYGVGKTYLLGALALDLAEKEKKIYLAHFPSLIGELRQSIATNQLSEKLDEMKKVDILMLDDIGGEALTDWIRDDILTVILDYRMRHQLPTFFSSNLTFDALEKHLMSTNKADDERKAKRLMERVRYLSQPIAITGSNRRNA